VFGTSWGDRHPLAATVASGFLAGSAFITRPQDAAIVLVVLGLTAFSRLRHIAVADLRRAGWWVAGALPPLLFLLIWNRRLYGQFFATGYNIGGHAVASLYPVIADGFGFSASFAPAIALRHLLWTMLRFNQALLGWPCSLLFVPLALRLRYRVLRTLAVVAGAVVAVYFFFPYYGFEYEARYYLPAGVALILLTAEGLARLEDLLRRAYQRIGAADSARARARALVLGICSAFAAYAWVYYWPQYLWPRYSGGYESVSRVVSRVAEQQAKGKSIVLIPADGPDHFRYGSGMVFNDPFLKSRIVYARKTPHGTQCLARSFPDRHLYIFLPRAGWRDGELRSVTTLRDQE